MLPTLKTKRLTLVPLADEHLPFETELDADPEVMKYITGKPRTPSQVVESHQHRLDLEKEHSGHGFWIGFDNDEPIGLFMLLPKENDQRSGDAAIGYRLLRKVWRQGYATEGSRAVMEYAFRELGFNSLDADAMGPHTGSQAVMVRLGMKFKREFRFQYEEAIEGSEFDDVEYGITREEWEALLKAEADAA